MIYIASPYTDSDPQVMEHRYQQVFRYCANLTMQGAVCFSPIVYGHQFFLAGHTPPNFEYWQSFNDHMLLASSEMRVLALPGYRQSRGVAYELDLADRNGIPVRLIKT